MPGSSITLNSTNPIKAWADISSAMHIFLVLGCVLYNPVSTRICFSRTSWGHSGFPVDRNELSPLAVTRRPYNPLDLANKNNH